MEECIILFHSSAYHQEELEALIYLGQLYRKRGNANLSLRKLNSALQLLSTKFPDDTRNLALIYKEMGVVYADNIFDFPQALEYCFKALSYDIPELEVPLHNNIGSIYRDFKDFRNAIVYLKKGEKIAEQRNQKEFLCYILENLGSVYLAEEQYELALQHYIKGFEIADIERVKNSSVNFIYILLLKSIGGCYTKIKNFELAEHFLKRALQESTSKGFQHLQTEAYLYIADLYEKRGEIDLFRQAISKGIMLCQKNDFKTLQITLLGRLQDYYEKKEDYHAAFDLSKQIHKENSKRLIQDTDENLSMILENRESEIFRLEEKNMQINRQKEELEQFAYIVTHDLKGPLINIGNYGKLIDSKYAMEFDKTGKDFVNFIVKDSERLLLMLDDLLQYIRVDQNPDQQISSNPNLILEDVQNSLRGEMQESGATIKYEKLQEVPIREVHLLILLKNLISNAIKFRDNTKPPIIEIKLEETPTQFKFQIKDNGIGIDDQFKDQIFQIFKRLDNINYKGTGIGLSMCKKIVSFYHGEIWVESGTPNGSSFYFTLKK